MEYYTQLFANPQFSTLLQAQQKLPITPIAWYGFGLLAVFTIIMVAVIIYMLSSLIRSDNARSWARFQIYEAILSLFLLLIFLGVTYLFFVTPSSIIGSLNIVPPQCQSTNQIFTLSSCDLTVFNNASFTLATAAYWSTFITSALPGVDAYAYPIPTDDGINLHITFTSLVPAGSAKLFGFLFSALLFMMFFNQLQLIIISGAVFFLAVFVSLGLIARTLGFTRTFGGAMIAFGIGVGLVYPFMVMVVYGFIDVNIPFVVSCANTSVPVLLCGAGSTFGGIASIITAGWTAGPTALVLGAPGTLLGNLVLSGGYIAAGLTIIPLLIVAIVDAFIIDFSSAIGERMSFGQLFSKLI